MTRRERRGASKKNGWEGSLFFEPSQPMGVESHLIYRVYRALTGFAEGVAQNCQSLMHYRVSVTAPEIWLSSPGLAIAFT